MQGVTLTAVGELNSSFSFPENKVSPKTLTDYDEVGGGLRNMVGTPSIETRVP